MKSTLPPGFTFSQSNLRDFLDCPRRFQWRHLQRRPWPALRTREMAAWEDAMMHGQQFHQLMFQASLKLDVQAQVADAPQPVRRWWQAWQNHPLADLPDERLFSELTLSVPVGDYALLARFDRLCLGDDGRAVIVDWKTDRHVPSPAALANRVQTIVYRYVLLEGIAHVLGEFPLDPAHVSLVYWFAESPAAPVWIGYSADDHRQASAQIHAWIEETAGLPADGFRRTTDHNVCRRCEYRALCGRDQGVAPDWWGDESDFPFEVPAGLDW